MDTPALLRIIARRATMERVVQVSDIKAEFGRNFDEVYGDCKLRRFVREDPDGQSVELLPLGRRTLG